jgi:precorrin-3B synthase
LIAQQFGSGDLQLTSRASVQLRGLPDPVPPALIAAVREAGFLPSETHERVRNIIASPLSGISGGLADLRPLVMDLDTRLCADPQLASLPTRFLFAVDDGRGDVSGKSFDLGYRAVDHDHGWLMLGAADLGIPVPASRAADMLLTLAREFLTASRLSGDVWHVRELPSWTTSVLAYARSTCRWRERMSPRRSRWCGVVQVPLGSLTPAQAATIEASAAGRVVITPSRGLVLPGAADRLPELVAAGLIDAASSPWSAISACVGAPSCEKSLIDTRSYATRLAQSGHPLPRTHISGCERRCGAPVGAHHDLVAPTAASPLLLVGESR